MMKRTLKKATAISRTDLLPRGDLETLGFLDDSPVRTGPTTTAAVVRVVDVVVGGAEDAVSPPLAALLLPLNRTGVVVVVVVVGEQLDLLDEIREGGEERARLTARGLPFRLLRGLLLLPPRHRRHHLTARLLLRYPIVVLPRRPIDGGGDVPPAVPTDVDISSVGGAVEVMADAREEPTRSGGNGGEGPFAAVHDDDDDDG